MEVFRTDGMTADEIAARCNQKWSPENEPEVVMRTAAFGHGFRTLEVCAKKDDYDVAGEHGQLIEKRRGLGDEVVVPWD
jgi:hypothetical protein